MIAGYTAAGKQLPEWSRRGRFVVTCDAPGCQTSYELKGSYRSVAIHWARWHGWSMGKQHLCPQHRHLARRSNPEPIHDHTDPV